jgi:hypothetical protein
MGGSSSQDPSTSDDGTFEFHQRCCAAPVRHSEDPMGTSVLISILITFLVVILVLYLVNMLPLDGRVKQIVQIIVIILGILSLLKYINVF